MMRIYNHKRDLFDERDLKFSEEHHVCETAALPASFDLRSIGYMPPILDQGPIGTCAANELSNGLRYCLEKEHGVVFQPSRLFIYWYGRVLDGSNTNEDTGITIRNGLKAIQKYGAPPEFYEPYDVHKFTVAPSQQAVQHAALHRKAFNYLSVKQDLDSIKHALFAGYPVVLGIQVYESLESPETLASGDIPMPNMESESCQGGHCVSLVGWNDETKRFIMENTWGTKDEQGNPIGKNGWFTIPYDYILNEQLTSDIWTVKFFK